MDFQIGSWELHGLKIVNLLFVLPSTNTYWAFIAGRTKLDLQDLESLLHLLPALRELMQSIPCRCQARQN